MTRVPCCGHYVFGGVCKSFKVHWGLPRASGHRLWTHPGRRTGRRRARGRAAPTPPRIVRAWWMVKMRARPSPPDARRRLTDSGRVGAEFNSGAMLDCTLVRTIVDFILCVDKCGCCVREDFERS